MKNSLIDSLKSKLKHKGIDNPESFTNTNLKELDDHVLDSVSGGGTPDWVLGFQKSHTKSGVHSKTVYEPKIIMQN